jgi:hypothetical protein
LVRAWAANCRAGRFKIVEQPIQLHVVAVQIKSGVERVEQLRTLSGRDLLRGRRSNLLETFIDRSRTPAPRPRSCSRHLALAPLQAPTVSPAAWRCHWP